MPERSEAHDGHVAVPAGADAATGDAAGGTRPKKPLGTRFWVMSILASALVALLAATLIVDNTNDDGVIDVRDLVDAEARGGVSVQGAEFEVGRHIPSASFDDLADGHRRTLDEFAGRPLVINFWGSTCAPCVAEMPLLEEASRQWAGRISLLGISVSDSVEAGRKMVARTKVTFPSGRDPRAEIFSAFGGTVQPYTVFVRADGTVAGVKTGALADADELNGLVTKYLP